MKISPITLESNLGVFGKDVKTPYDLEILLLGICLEKCCTHVAGDSTVIIVKD